MNYDVMNKRLIELRKKTGRTQQDIADYLGVGVGTISSYEKQRTKWGICEVSLLAELYDVSIDYLVGRIEYSSLNPQGELSMVYRENERLMKECTSLKNKISLISHILDLG